MSCVDGRRPDDLCSSLFTGFRLTCPKWQIMMPILPRHFVYYSSLCLVVNRDHPFLSFRLFRKSFAPFLYCVRNISFVDQMMMMAILFSRVESAVETIISRPSNQREKLQNVPWWQVSAVVVVVSFSFHDAHCLLGYLFVNECCSLVLAPSRQVCCYDGKRYTARYVAIYST